jgi:hypothetical protein
VAAMAVADVMKRPKAVPTVVKAKAVTVAPVMPKPVKARKPAQNVLRAMAQTVLNAPSVQTVTRYRVPMVKPKAVVAAVVVAVASVHRDRVSVPRWMPRPWGHKTLCKTQQPTSKSAAPKPAQSAPPALRVSAVSALPVVAVVAVVHVKTVLCQAGTARMNPVLTCVSPV